ncbi:30S ribosomal protein S8 [Patescibacteria group bacterium]|nr:30S ribosomal protein S8 [Patescibacteria group bacterium]
MTDPISDMLTRIRNSQAVCHETVTIPFSKIKFEIAKVLEKEGFIDSVETKGKKVKKTIEVGLKYKDGAPAIAAIKRVSKPGQRIYVKKNEVKSVREGYGISIISTSRGVMTNKEARENNLGGEVICQVY